MIFRKIQESFSYRITQNVYKHMFGHIGAKSIIYSPLKLVKTESIYIGNNVSVYDGAWFMAGDKKSLVIHDGTTIGHYSHIVARYKVEIDENVLIADKVFITDCTHNYEDINVPIVEQGIRELKPVTIGEGSWIGENVCVLGASVGKHCVVAANAVVLNDIPDYTIAAGVPAKVIKVYDFTTGTWRKNASAE